MTKEMTPEIKAQYNKIRRDMEAAIAGTYKRTYDALRPLGYDRETIRMVADREELKLHREGWDKISTQFADYDF